MAAPNLADDSTTRLFYFIVHHPIKEDELFLHRYYSNNRITVKYIIFHVSSFFINGYIFCHHSFEYHQMKSTFNITGNRFAFNYCPDLNYKIYNQLCQFKFSWPDVHIYGTPPSFRNDDPDIPTDFLLPSSSSSSFVSPDLPVTIPFNDSFLRDKAFHEYKKYLSSTKHLAIKGKGKEKEKDTYRKNLKINLVRKSLKKKNKVFVIKFYI